VLAAGADNPLVLKQPHVDDLRERRRPERRQGAELEGREVPPQLLLGGEPQMAAGAEDLTRAPHVRRSDTGTTASRTPPRSCSTTVLAVASGSAAAARASASAEYVASCSTVS